MVGRFRVTRLLCGIVCCVQCSFSFFLTLRNFFNIASNMAYIGVMASVQTALIIGGVMDLSMGASAQFCILLSFTLFGRTVYAVGGNPVASKLCGINNARVLTILFVLSGTAGATSGILVASMLGAAAPAALSGTILTVIASVILGGTSLSGGSGSIWGTLLGVLILGTLTNGLVILNVSSFWQEVTQGLVLLAAVGIDQIRQRRERA